ncbi:hypothetical protein WJX84_004073 [Apatococcus fuscideae]|uniref:Mitotic spindle assembly checkpoint protein MAD1 n=1 Tax=Apatococcus fuscideae TaxID=2026836 RepID=A0AAW1TIN1_9CHLO
MSRKIAQGLCTSANKHREALIQQNRRQLDELEIQLRKEIGRSSSLLSQKKRLEIEHDEISQASAQEQLVLEAQQMKDRYRNMLIVEEKLHSAEARAKRADTEVAKLSELPAAIEKLQTELFQWQREVMEIASAATADEALPALKLLSHAKSQAKNELSEQSAVLAEKEGMLTQAQQQLKQAEGGLVTAAAAAARSQNLAEMSDKKARMLLKDNQSLKDLLASYSEEQQMSGSEDLQMQIASLEESLGRGEYNSGTTKVLHFIRSPEAELARQADQAKLETLQAENEALRSQLSHGIEMSDESQSENVAAAMAKAHVVGLERKVQELEKSRTRLQQKEIALMPNDFTNQHLRKEVQTFLERYQSAPAFTANYTLEMFQKDTQC